MKATHSTGRHRPGAPRCDRLLSVFPLLVVLFAADSCSGKNGADVVPQDAEVTPPTPDDMDSSVSPETPPPTDVTDTADNVELVVDLQELGKVDLDAPGPEGEVVPPPNLFPYKLVQPPPNLDEYLVRRAPDRHGRGDYTRPVAYAPGEDTIAIAAGLGHSTSTVCR